MNLRLDLHDRDCTCARLATGEHTSESSADSVENDLLLFDLGPPTTRRVADLVKEGGVAALTEADTRADAATYQEVRCRSALNHVKGMRYFDWTLNPYRGCTHGCHYCYARRYHSQFELGAGDEFASVILVKTNFVEVLRKELARPSWTREVIGLGTATDCYQPIEGHYKLTRRTLEALIEFRSPAGVITKGPMIVRDKELLAALCGIEGSSVVVSVPCSDEEVTAQARARNGAAPPAAARGARAARCGRQRRRAHEPHRARHLVEARG